VFDRPVIGRCHLYADLWIMPMSRTSVLATALPDLEVSA
jgi:hypothetical protein